MQNEKMDEIFPKFPFVVDIFLVSLFENNREGVPTKACTTENYRPVSFATNLSLYNKPTIITLERLKIFESVSHCRSPRFVNFEKLEST